MPSHNFYPSQRKHFLCDSPFSRFQSSLLRLQLWKHVLPRDLKRDILSPSDFSLKRMHIWGNASVDMVNPWPGCVLPFKRLPLDLHRKARYNFSFFPPRKCSQHLLSGIFLIFLKMLSKLNAFDNSFFKKKKKERQIYRFKKWNKLKIKRRAFKWFELRQLFQFDSWASSCRC